MKININIDPGVPETEISITAPSLSDELEKVLASLRALDFKLTGSNRGQTFILDASEVLYIDTVDKKTFLYTENEVYESAMKLYELEQQLATKDFFRAGKSSIINFNKIKSLKSDMDGRIIVTMENKEKLVVSKQYAVFIKAKLGR
ncbi:MAG: LytTR family transcriptional regulator DNA-binding domain-containing protein [Oscillospiraceae bacterium]|nr:LytTR family transcriptional regulator DNA-binding domain-containing protein [Oscillospiraceae bacterium]